MTLKQRLEKLEQAMPEADDRLSVAWRSIATRNGDVLSEAVHSAFILPSDSAPGEAHERRAGESEQVFIRHVLERAAIVHSRHDEAFAEGIRWRPSPDCHLTH